MATAEEKEAASTSDPGKALVDLIGLLRTLDTKDKRRVVKAALAYYGFSIENAEQ